MKKLIVSTFITIAMFALLIPISFAETADTDNSVEKNVVDIYFDSSKMTIYNKTYDVDVPPLVTDETVLAPGRAIVEVFGGSFTGDFSSPVATIKIHNHTVAIPVGSNKFSVDGIEYQTDNPAVIVDGRTLIPLEDIAKACGSRVTTTINGSSVHYIIEYHDTPKAGHIYKSSRIEINTDTLDIKKDYESQVFDMPPQYSGNDILVPLRAGGELLEAYVIWYEDTQTVVFNYLGKTVSMTIGSNITYIDGEEKEIDVAPIIIDDRAFVPLLSLADALGYSVDKKASKKSIIITYHLIETPYYEITDDWNLIISGKGAIPDYNSTIETLWNDYADKIKKVTVCNGITAVGQYSFMNFTQLENVELPVSIEKISRYAFPDTYTYDIYYKGTASQWNSIGIEEENDYLINATVHYNSLSEEKFTIYYYMNGGNDLPQESVYSKDDTAYITNYLPQRTGYEFIGWSTSKYATDAEYFSGDVYEGNTDISLYAIWSEIPKTSTTVKNYGSYSIGTINLKNVPYESILIIAKYKDNNLSSLETRTNLENTEMFSIFEDCNNIKIMVWDSINNLKPITSAESVSM